MRFTMPTYALVVFAVAALGGIILASHVLRGRLAPWALSIGHALLGATGLVLLLLTVLQGPPMARVTAALALFAVAALGGFYLASLHLRKTVAPGSVIVVHAGVAIAGILTLLSVVLGW
jgi:hypothetical protein